MTTPDVSPSSIGDVPTEDGRLGFADRATDASHEAPAGLRPDGSVSTGAKHTALPWSIAHGFDMSGRGRPPAAYVAGTDPASVGIKLSSPWIEGAWDGDLEATANAEFIVRACNSHYELLRIACNLLAFAEIKWGNQDEDANEAFADARCVIATAQGIEARQRQDREGELGPKDESPVGNADAPDLSPETAALARSQEGSEGL